MDIHKNFSFCTNLSMIFKFLESLTWQIHHTIGSKSTLCIY